MAIKIAAGTANSKNLCDSCKSSTKVEFQNGKITWFCSNYSIAGDATIRLPNYVASCTAFIEKSHISLYDHEKHAWIIEISKANKIGFLTPKAWKRKNKNDETEDDHLDDPFM